MIYMGVPEKCGKQENNGARKRKVPKDLGEYVDYEEVKD